MSQRCPLTCTCRQFQHGLFLVFEQLFRLEPNYSFHSGHSAYHPGLRSPLNFSYITKAVCCVAGGATAPTSAAAGRPAPTTGSKPGVPSSSPTFRSPTAPKPAAQKATNGSTPKADSYSAAKSSSANSDVASKPKAASAAAPNASAQGEAKPAAAAAPKAASAAAPAKPASSAGSDSSGSKTK